MRLHYSICKYVKSYLSIRNENYICFKIPSRKLTLFRPPKKKQGGDLQRDENFGFCRRRARENPYFLRKWKLYFHFLFSWSTMRKGTPPFLFCICWCFHVRDFPLISKSARVTNRETKTRARALARDRAFWPQRIACEVNKGITHYWLEIDSLYVPLESIFSKRNLRSQ